MNRRGVTTTSQFGSESYSREELVAEMGAAFLCGHCGIEATRIDQSASYIQSWLIRLRDDRRLMVQAAAQAQKACDFILGTTPDEDEPGKSALKEFKVVTLLECPTPPDVRTRDTGDELRSTEPCASSLRRRSSVSIQESESQRRAESTASGRTLKIEADGDFWKGIVKPKIRLTGCWLERAGFKAGSHVRVTQLSTGVIELRSADVLMLNQAQPAPPDRSR